MPESPVLLDRSMAFSAPAVTRRVAMIALGLSRFCDSQEGFNDTAMTGASHFFRLFQLIELRGAVGPKDLWAGIPNLKARTGVHCRNRRTTSSPTAFSSEP